MGAGEADGAEVTLCHAPTNGGPPQCLRDDDFDRINDRIDASEERDGQIVADIAGTREIATRVLEELLAFRSEVTTAEERRQRECDIRHKPIERRLDRLEDHDDTLTATSAVTYSDEALRRRYEERKAENAELATRIGEVETALRDAQGAVEVERERAKRAMWIALPAIVVAVAGIVTTVLQMMGM